MHLIGVKEENSWIMSRWELTYRVAWDSLLKGVASAYEYYSAPEILAGDKPVTVKNKKDILKIREDRTLVIRGLSKILKVPIMITFYNQLSAVDVSVAPFTDEFKNTDYEKFNHSLCQYMDSMEIAMYKK